MESYFLVVFESKNHAVLLYTLLEAKGDNLTQLVSTPCRLKSGCSYSIKVKNKSHLKSVIEEAQANHLKNLKFYYIEKISGKTTYKEIKP